LPPFNPIGKVLPELSHRLPLPFMPLFPHHVQQYTLRSIAKARFIKGGWLSIKRILAAVQTWEEVGTTLFHNCVNHELSNFLGFKKLPQSLNVVNYG